MELAPPSIGTASTPAWRRAPPPWSWPPTSCGPEPLRRTCGVTADGRRPASGGTASGRCPLGPPAGPRWSPSGSTTPRPRGRAAGPRVPSCACGTGRCGLGEPRLAGAFVTEPVPVVGGGLAGLACAQDYGAGVDCRVLEASDGLGWWVRTSRVDGYLLDRGAPDPADRLFPGAVRLDLDGLDLARFAPGAESRGRRVPPGGDPLRVPATFLSTLTAPIGSVANKLRGPTGGRRADPPVAGYAARRPGPHDGRSPCRGRILRPDGRVLLATASSPASSWTRALEASARRFEVILRMLAVGGTGVPRRGMGALPAQLAAGLPDGCVELGAMVTRVDGPASIWASGRRVPARAVVVATEGPAAHRLPATGWPTPVHGPRRVAGSRRRRPRAPAPPSCSTARPAARRPPWWS